MAVQDFHLQIEPRDAEAIGASLLLDSCCRVLILKRNSEILNLNVEAERFLRSTRDQVIGTPLVDYYPSELREGVLAWLNQAYVTGADRVTGEYILWGQRWNSTARRIPLKQGEDCLVCVSQQRTDLVALPQLVEMIGRCRDRRTALGDLHMLTDREVEVAALIAASLTDSEIAGELHRSIRTVHAHRRSIGEKLQMRRRSGVADLMRSRGLGALPSGQVAVRSSESNSVLSNRFRT